jgi:hypothetical protein
MAIKKITITVTKGKKGNLPYTDTDFEIETTDNNQAVKGSEVLAVLNSAMSMILEEMAKS